MAGLNDQGANSQRARPSMMKAVGVASVCTALGLGLSSLATVGSDHWIETSYREPRPAATAAAAVPAPVPAIVTPAASIVELPPKLVVGDEQQWLSASGIPTQKVVAASAGAGGFSLGDRVVFSVAAKGGASPLARTFEVVGIEAIAIPDGSPAAKQLPHVLIAREVDPTGKPMTLRLLVTENDDTLPSPQKTL